MVNEEKAISTVEAIKQWAIDRNLHTADPNKQIWKLIEENGELAAGVSKGKLELIEDAIGDMVVVQTILLMQVGRSINQAFDDIEELMTDTPYRTDDDCMIGIIEQIHKLFLEVEMSKIRENNGFFGVDGVSNILIALYDIALNHNLDFNKCIDAAYNEIKDRKGRMVDGVFVKEADL